MSFISLHSHSHFSLLDSIAKPKDIAKRLVELGQPAFALTDHGTTSGLLEMYHECQKNNLKMIFGCEHYWTYDATIKDGTYRHVVFLAKNFEGYQNLLKLTTEAHQNFYRKPRVDIDIIRKYAKGLKCGSACLGGILRVFNESTNKYEVNIELLEQFLGIFGKDFYIELHTYSPEEQREWNFELIKVAEKYKIPMVAAVDSHYVLKSQSETHKKFLTQGKEREDGYYQCPDFYLHSEQEVREALSYLPSDIVEKAIANTQVITDECNVEFPDYGINYPKLDVKDEREAVLDVMRKNWKRKLPDKSKWSAHVDRVKYEMDVLEKAGYFQYFLIISDVLEFCRDNDIALGTSRGSAAGCDVAYIMGIHRTDPIEFDLIFERFLHLQRVGLPDVDLDVSKRDRGKVIDYLKDKYGEVYQARTFSYMGAKGALKRAGNCLGYDPQVINGITKGIPKYSDDDYSGEEHERYLIDSCDCDSGLKELAKSFVGVIISYGIHASAAIVFPCNPSYFTAIEKSKDNYVTAYDFHDIEAMGVLKIDCLGLKTTDVIKDTIELIGEDIDIINIPQDDTKTFDMLAKGNTLGVFQIENQGFTQLIKRVKPRCLKEFAPLMAVYRPGIIAAGLLETYIRRVTGEEPIEYLHPDLETITSSTAGLIVFQEQIIEIAKKFCGYSAGEADMVRRAVAKKKPEEMAKIKPDFISKSIANGYTKEVATKLFELIEYFSAYGFGKGHSFGYGQLSYATAYLKANYPKEFMVSLINSEKEQEDIVPYITECKSLGIPILHPDLSIGNLDWQIEDNSIRMGLGYIKGIGKNLTVKPCETFNEIVEHNAKNVVENLTKAGALDYLSKPRALLLSSLVNTQEILSRRQQCLEKIQENTTGLHEAEQAKDDKLIRKFTRQINSWQAKLDEVNQKSTIVINNESYDQTAEEFSVLSMSFSEIPKVKTGKLTKVFTKEDKKKKLMAWLTFECQTYGTIRATVFASQWSKIKTSVTQGETYVFCCSDKGILEEISIDGHTVVLKQKQWNGQKKRA